MATIRPPMACRTKEKARGGRGEGGVQRTIVYRCQAKQRNHDLRDRPTCRYPRKHRFRIPIFRSNAHLLGGQHISMREPVLASGILRPLTVLPKGQLLLRREGRLSTSTANDCSAETRYIRTFQGDRNPHSSTGQPCLIITAREGTGSIKTRVASSLNPRPLCPSQSCGRSP